MAEQRSRPTPSTGGTTAAALTFDDLGTPLRDVTFAVLDLETTGLSPERDRITEIGVVKVRGGEVLGELQTLVRPEIPIPAAVATLTGITDELVARHPPIEAALPALLEFLRGTTLVAHNAHFDLGFLRAACRRHAYPPLEGPTVCTARLARRALDRGEVRNVRLGTLADHFRTRVRPEHRALSDARATVDVLHGLLERVGSLGVNTLEELREYTRSTSDPAYRKIGLVDGAPDAPGVYRFLDARGEVLYVGKAVRLRERLRTYFGQDRRRKVADLVRETASVTWELAPTGLEAAVREVRAIHRHRPRYNRRSRRPERAVYVKLTRERYPRLSIVTAVRDPRALHVGPLSSRGVAERFCDAVHEVVALRQCTDRLTAERGRAPCVLKDLGRCGAPCDGSQDVDGYARVVAEYEHATAGDPTTLLDALRGRMERHAEAGRYERAREVRSGLHLVARVLADARRLRALIDAGDLVASRTHGDVHEVVAVRRGRLVATERSDGPASAERLADTGRRLLRLAPEVGDGLPDRSEVEEVRLVARWLEEAGTRLVLATAAAPFAVPVAGGRELAAVEEERRRVARAVRRDREVLRGGKVRAGLAQAASSRST